MLLTHCPAPCFLPAACLGVHAAPRDLSLPPLCGAQHAEGVRALFNHCRGDGHLQCVQCSCVTAIIASVNILGRVSSSRRECFYRADGKKQSDVPDYFQLWVNRHWPCFPSRRPQSLVSASLVQTALSKREALLSLLLLACLLFRDSVPSSPPTHFIFRIAGLGSHLYPSTL